MHGVEVISPYLQLVQIGIIVGIVNLLAQIPALKLIGIPAISMGLSLIVGSILPTLAPEAYSLLFPVPPSWPQLIQFFVVSTLGFMAGTEIKLENIHTMGRTGGKFIGYSMLAPVVFAAPIAAVLAWMPRSINPFIPADANALAVFVGIIAVVFMRALPTMIAFFKGAGWNNAIAKTSLAGASLDDLTVFVIAQPLVQGIVSNNGFFGILTSGAAVLVTGSVMFIACFLIRKTPKNVQLPLTLFALFVGCGLAEMYGHVHIILTGIFVGLFMTMDYKFWEKKNQEGVVKQHAHESGHQEHSELEVKLSGWVLTVGVPLFFAGLGLTKSFNLLSIWPWVITVLCFAAAYFGHELITAPKAANLFGGNKAAGRIMAGLCRTHGTADVLFAVFLADIGLINGLALSGIVLFMMLATIQGFLQAQQLVNANPELALAEINPVVSRPVENIPTQWEQPLVYASAPDNEDK